MPSSSIFAISNKGRVFALQTNQSIWKELQYLGIDFKRVSAHDTVVWALGGDHQIYVYVYGTSVPIRVCEESYENQRWNPVEGFTSNLLPSDRPSFSSSDGLLDRKLSDIHLPSLAWNWEGPWHMQDTFEGKALDKEGWTYAVDFPRHYIASKKWNSCVRRRKWIRYRSYIALDTWSAVPSIHKDHTQEPFIDICVGGGNVLGEDTDKLMVWGVTALGKVMVREGICATCPEGSHWTHVETPSYQDVTSLSVSQCGRMWAVTWDGSVLARTGISRDNPLGLGWQSVDPPEDLKIQQLTVGNSVAWCVCRDFSVWFRRGLDNRCNGSFQQTSPNNSDVGYSWLPMVGSLVMLSVGPNDQVWGITADDHSIVMRTGVTSTELTGKTWKIINLPLCKFDPDKPYAEGDDLYDEDSSSESISEARKSSIIVAKELKGSLSNVSQASESQDAVSMNLDLLDSGESSLLYPIKVNQIVPEQNCSDLSDLAPAQEVVNDISKVNDAILKVNSDELHPIKSKEIPAERNVCPVSADLERIRVISGSGLASDELSSSEFGEFRIRNPEETTDSMNSSVISDTVVNFIGPDYVMDDSKPKILCNDGDNLEPDQKTVFSHDNEEEEINLNELPAKTLADYMPKLTSSRSSVNSEVLYPKNGQSSVPQDEPLFYGITLPEENLWMWVSGSGCWVQPQNLPKWFLADYSSFAANEPWKKAIKEQLQERKEKETSQFHNYSDAVECSSWVFSGKCRFLVSGQWVPANIEIHIVGSRGCLVKEAFLKLIYTLGIKKLILIPCSSIVLSTIMIDLPAKAVVSLYTPSQPLNPIPLLFSAERDAEEWLNHISSACLQLNTRHEQLSHKSVWAVSSLGFIYTHNCASVEEKEIEEDINYILEVKDGKTPFLEALHKGFKTGYSVTVTGMVHDEALRFHVDLLVDETPDNIAIHFNPRFNDKIIVFNSREDNIWKNEEKEHLRHLGRGRKFEATIVCHDRDFEVIINGKVVHNFNHRLAPGTISHIAIGGEITITDVTYNCVASKQSVKDLFWRGVGGHLNRVESGAGGVTWGISYDNHVYTFTGDSEASEMSDVRHFYVYENQRWNPVTGFTNRGLPTDRKTWSDQSGKHERTKEGLKLPSRHWQWVSDWTVDHHTPNGVDKEGWQYATDFPMSYHGHRYVTDLVRRRRWLRKCRISTTGPWKQLEKVALISLSVSPQYSDSGYVPVWGVSVSNEVVMREGVTHSCGRGNRWTLIPSETPMKEVCAGIEFGVWAISCDGQAHLRIGVTKANPKGYDWVNIDAPAIPLKQIGHGNWKVWAVDREGFLYFRLNVHQALLEGTAWEKVCGEVDSISVSEDGSLWGILKSFQSSNGDMVAGVLARRKGVTAETPGGTGWEIGTGIGWSHISARIPFLWNK